MSQHNTSNNDNNNDDHADNDHVDDHLDNHDDVNVPDLDLIFMEDGEEMLGNNNRIEEILAHYGGTYIGGWIDNVIRGEGVIRLLNGVVGNVL